MKLLNLVLDNQNWKVLDGEIIEEEYGKVCIVFLFGNTDVIKDKRYSLGLKIFLKMQLLLDVLLQVIF